MQKGVGQRSKFNTGNPMIDIVTDADLAVQEFLLKEISKTELVNCRLLAEEDTSSVKKFNEQGNYYLVLDPIDGTATYAEGGQFFSVIVSLHDGSTPLYTFVYFPALHWTHKIVGNAYLASGVTPMFDLPPEAEHSIAYSGNPEKTIPDIYHELKNKHTHFVRLRTIGKGIGPIPMFLCNKVAGIYKEDVNAYDGLVELHFALARGLKIHSGGPSGVLDLSNIKKREFGLFYPGYYLALNE